MRFATVPLTLVALALTTASTGQTQARPRRSMVWELGVALSAGIVYRMDTMPAQNKAGNEMLAHARNVATRLGTTLPDHKAVQGAEVDTWIAIEYLYDPRQHPIAVYLAERDGKATAGLFTLGALSHLAMMAITPSSEAAKDLAARLETAALEGQLPRASWGGLVDALRNGTSSNDVKEEMVKMIQAVAAATGK
jgi:hypothetical protein